MTTKKFFAEVATWMFLALVCTSGMGILLLACCSGVWIATMAHLPLTHLTFTTVVIIGLPPVAFTAYLFRLVTGSGDTWLDRGVHYVIHALYGWGEYPNWKNHLVEYSHQGITGLVLFETFYNIQRAYDSAQEKKGIARECGKATIYAVPNVMTFSDDPRQQGRVTGTMEDLQKLERGCRVFHMPFVIPGTSALSPDAPEPISLKQARKMIAGK